MISAGKHRITDTETDEAMFDAYYTSTLKKELRQRCIDAERRARQIAGKHDTNIAGLRDSAFYEDANYAALTEDEKIDVQVYCVVYDLYCGVFNRCLNIAYPKSE